MANGFVVAKLVLDKVYPGETEKIIAQLTIRKDNVRKGKGQPPLYFDTRTKQGTHSETFCLTLGADVGVPCRARLTFTNHLSRHYAAVSNIKITAITLDKLTMKN